VTSPKGRIEALVRTLDAWRVQVDAAFKNVSDFDDPSDIIVLGSPMKIVCQGSGLPVGFFISQVRR